MKGLENKYIELVKYIYSFIFKFLFFKLKSFFIKISIFSQISKIDSSKKLKIKALNFLLK